ncbi:MAG TPA: folylpolyglutamate synthase/dihydrofolate synthase family protein [Pirellulales bacterium]|nr:folylpolyglutamate synthase/dihydrofolate synthase family protein [Pirellulales bacterium]
MSDAYQAALSFLYGRIDYERALAMPYGSELKLDRMRELLVRLGNPQDRLPIVHVAGTKGKGSTSAMIAAALSAAGYTTGLYTSPHLDRLEERFMIDGRACTADELVRLTDQLRPVVAEMDREACLTNGDTGPTYFELTTALAWLHFVERGIDVAVAEVGLGGRLDSTNVCRPRLTIITSISFDHMKQLGNTLEAIAREKAGIVKPGVPVISGVTAERPRREIELVCQQSDAPRVQLGRDFDFAYHPARRVDEGPIWPTIDFVSHTAGREQYRRGVALGLLGSHQAANAALALASLDQLALQGWSLPETAIRRGLAEVRWPARVEVVGRRPTLVLDAAHNVASIAALVQTLRESFSARERLLVFATTQEKQVAQMLALLLPDFDRVILTRYQNNPRGVPPEELAALARGISEVPVQVCADPSAAWQAAREQAGEEDLVCVTGSFFIAAEMRALWTGDRLASPAAR